MDCVLANKHHHLEPTAEEAGLTQSQFNDFINEHPEYFRLENMPRNRSHVDETPGKGELQDIIKDMNNFIGFSDYTRVVQIKGFG